MQKFILSLLLFPIFLLAQPSAVKNTNDPEADKWLKLLQTKYNKIGFSLDFSIKIEGDNTRSSSISGSYTGYKQNYILKTSESTTIYNGSTLWSINPKDKEVSISSTSKANNKKIESPIDIVQRYNQLFKYRVKEPISRGIIILELVPKNKYSNYFKIDLTINTISQKIEKAKLYEKSGARIYYTITSSKDNLSISSSYFTLNTDEYKDYEVMDMR